jgi:2-phospho-L-lactate guanylyltransferase
MSLWALVPVKPLQASKSRLAGALSPDERANLSRDFLLHTLDVLARVPALTGTFVVSRDPHVLALAHERSVRSFVEEEPPELNAALRTARQAAVNHGADSVLALPTDLPLLAVDDINQLVAEDRPNRVVIAPDRHGRGTNALLVHPPELMDFAFGPDSFGRHCALAERAGAEVRVCHLAGVELDVDLPEDLRLYQAAMDYNPL